MSDWSEVDAHGNVVPESPRYSNDHRWKVMRGSVLLLTCRTREEARRIACRQGGHPRCRVADRCDDGWWSEEHRRNRA